MRECLGRNGAGIQRSVSSLSVVEAVSTELELSSSSSDICCNTRALMAKSSEPVSALRKALDASGKAVFEKASYSMFPADMLGRVV